MGDLRALIDNEEREARRLEYKLTLPGETHEEKKKFLWAVSSFANAGGGYLLYGIRERRDPDGQPTGIPEAIVGLPDANLDQEMRRLENLIRTCIMRRIPGVRLLPIVDPEDPALPPVLAIWIPNSSAKLHMVTYQGHIWFYSRNSNGKYQLNVDEIRAGFLASEAARDKIRHFRQERLDRIESPEAPVHLEPGAKAVLHVVPLSALEPGFQLAVGDLYEHRVSLRPISGAFSGWRYNFDGFLTYDKDREATWATSYLQVFRSGCLEAVHTDFFYVSDGERRIRDITLGERLFDALNSYFGVLQTLEISPPILVLVTLLGVREYEIFDPTRDLRRGHAIDRDTMICPEVSVEEWGQSAEQILRGPLDVIWNALGFPSCFNYDGNGRWIYQRGR